MVSGISDRNMMLICSRCGEGRKVSSRLGTQAPLVCAARVVDGKEALGKRGA